MKKLQSDSSSPLYHQLMLRLAEDIERGVYSVGSRIPPEHELEALYQVSRVTVRRALAELTSEGLLEKKQGKGTFVSTPRISQDLKSIHSFHDACKQNGFQGGTLVIHVKETEANSADLEELKLPKGSKVIETLRVRTADGVPVVLEKNHFSMAYSYLENENLAGSLYIVLRDYGIEPKQASHDISMAYATESQAKLLEVDPGAPLMRLHEVVYDQKGRPLHNSLQLIRGDRFVFRI
ncbi:MAG: GntR family transcriptional regulator [Clostridia bacterium]|jgi:GntR family transcriptional regulator|nr:GntR family transcriptional regulator [Clostridia bacterium]MBR4576433.1 GntR family transcriptional regulator [Clostridia bacterium]